MQYNKEHTEEDKIIAVTRQLTDGMIARDTAAMDGIVAEDFTLTHITGYVQTKSEWFRAIRQESMKYYAYTEVQRSVNISETKARFVGQNILDACIWGIRNNWRIQQTMQLEQRNGQWIILNSVATTF